ncbi:MAG: TonB-dependent receptor [Gemmatimonadota bacterium]|nr:MAG: TonB-dependent receptor [Gemmatimonadota bacterium]
MTALRALVLSAVLEATLLTLAIAQVPDSTTADSIPLYRLEGITVAVSRSPSDLNRLPYAVGLVGSTQIQGLEATVSLDESLLAVPGVLVNNRYNFALGNRISIRGFGSRAQFGVRGIRLIQDGIPLSLPDGQAQLNNIDLSAAGRIEVIRGPASALYGNAAGGVISIETGPAPDVRLRPQLSVLGGSFGEGRLYQKYDLQLSGRDGRFDYLGHLGYFQTDGYRLHSEARSTLFNTRWRYRPDSQSQLTLLLNYAAAPQAENPSSLDSSLARAKPDTARDIVLPPDQCPASPGFGGCQDLGEESRQGQAGLAYQRRFGLAHELSLMGYGVFRHLDNRIPFRLIELDRWAAGWRTMYRFAPPGSRLEGLTLGLDLDHQTDDRIEFFRDDTGIGDVRLDQDELVTALGGFALAELLLAPPLGLNLSLRYDRVRFQAKDRLISPDDPDDSGTRVLDQWSPMVGIRYPHARWLNLYGNVGRSFQTPTTTELTDTLGGFNQNLEPERSINYELGLKGTVASRLSYSLALFRVEIEDQLIGSEASGSERVYFSNAGSSVNRGAEVGFSTLLAEGITLMAAYTYSDFRFRDFQMGGEDFSGNALPGVPPHQLHARLHYDAAGPSGTLKVTAVDEFFVDNANLDRDDGYAVIDLRLGYTVGLPRIEARAFVGVNNLLNTRYNSSVVVNATAGRYYEPAPGRNLYLGLRLTGS